MSAEINQSALIVFLIGIMLLSGCTAVPLLKEEDANFDKITNFEPEQSRSVIYILRGVESDFQGHELIVDVNGESVATYPMSYKRLELDPGAINLEPSIPGAFSFEEEENFDIKAGEVFFVRMEAHARLGIPNTGSVKKIPADQATQMIKINKLKPVNSESI